MFHKQINRGRVNQGFVLASVLYSLYINDALAVPGTHLALFANDTCVYAKEKQERHVLCKLQSGLTAVKLWCECWNIIIDEGKTQATCFPRRLKVPGDILLLNR
jgi:hypothetical protein